MSEKRVLAGDVKVNSYRVLHQAVENGIAYGWMRAHKHEENPSEDVIKDLIHDGVMLEISEWFLFDTAED